MKPRLVNAITGRFNGRQRELRCNVLVRPFTGTDQPGGASCNCSGIWDTGATNSAITKEVAKKLSLKPIDQVETGTANGVCIFNVYLVQIVILDRITKVVRVTEANLRGADMLIGMDIIGDGDFAISTDTKTGDMYLSYQVPSQGKIDFVEKSNQRNKQHRATLRKKNRKKKKK